MELSHEIDYLNWIFGPLKLEKSILKTSGLLDIDVEDSADLLAITKNEAVVSIHLDLLSVVPHRYCRVMCENGDILWDYINQTVSVYCKHKCEVVYTGGTDEKNDMYKSMMESFFKFQKGQPFQGANVKDGIMQFIQAARQ